MKHPVIILIDNDSGSGPVFGIIKNKCKVTPTVPATNTTAPFYHLYHNLYLVKTLETPPKMESMIEDFFSPSLLAATMGGKSFNLTNKSSAASEVGKAAFSQFVRANANKVGFSNFSELLSRIVAVVEHFKLTKPA